MSQTISILLIKIRQRPMPMVTGLLIILRNLTTRFFLLMQIVHANLMVLVILGSKILFMEVVCQKIQELQLH